MIRLLVDRGLLPPSEIPFRLRLDERDIEELTGLESGYFRNMEQEPPSSVDSETSEEQGNDDQRSHSGILPFPGSA